MIASIFIFLRMKCSRFDGDTIVNSMGVRQFKICPSVYLSKHSFFAKNTVKIDPLSQNLYMFLK